jgi:hypothetical protein
MEEHGLRVKAKRVLKKIFGPKSDERRKNWRKQHAEELNIGHECCYRNEVKGEVGGTRTVRGNKRNSYRVLGTASYVRRQRERTRNSWEGDKKV